MYATEYGDCGGSEAEHICHTCAEAFVREFGRVQSSGYVKRAYYTTLKANPTDVALWIAGIEAGSIIMIPETAGSYDPGDPKELKGFGGRKVTYGPRTMKLNFFDPIYFDNYHFYNEISNRTDLIPFFRTSSLLHLFDKPATIKAKDPVEDDLESEVIWSVECEITSRNIPAKYPIADIEEVFVCPAF